MSFKIVLDSCGELLEEWKYDDRMESVPLTLMVEDETIIDDETFDQKAFLAKVAASPTYPRSACPSPERYRQAFDCEADHVYAVTLSAELSGSYNSAVLGKNLLEEEQGKRKIHVFNSRSASIGETLIAIRIRQCEEQGMEFEKIVQTVEKYIDSMNTYFVLESLDALRKNGRLTGVKAIVATALKIKPIMGSTDIGSICQLGQARGMNRALQKMLDFIVERTADSQNRILAISNCNCRERAMMLKAAVEERLNPVKVIVLDTAGVSSLYASDGGIIVAV
ncbi:MAG: DegV family protein [Blautia sp.]|nr:DegV family protein [Blautia sp.]